jgi:hypothetical protein
LGGLKEFMSSIHDEGVIHGDNIEFANEWWKRLYDILCSLEENKQEFHDTYLDRRNVSGSLLKYREVIMRRRNSKLIREYKEAVLARDIKSLKVILQDMFAEPVRESEVVQYLELCKDVKVDDFLQYVKDRPGIRFCYAMRHYK